MRTVLTIAGILLVTALAVFGLQAAGLISYQFWAPKYEDARREVFENTASFHAGTRRDFDNLRLAYLQAATPAEKEAIRDVLRHRAAGVSPELLTKEIQTIIAGE